MNNAKPRQPTFLGGAFQRAATWLRLRLSSKQILGPIRGRAAVVLTIDLTLSAFSLPAAIAVRAGGEDFDDHRIYAEALPIGIPLFVIVCATVFSFSGLYKSFWRYVSVHDIVATAKSAALALLIFSSLLFFINRLEAIPRSVPLIQFLLLVILMSGTRILYRGLLWRTQRRQGTSIFRVPALLIGLNANAELFIRATDSDPHAPFTVVGILNIDGQHIGRAVHRVPVLGTVGEMKEVVSRLEQMKLRPQRLLLAEPVSNINGLVKMAESLGMTVGYLPTITELRASVDGRATAHVFPQDLLRRPAVVLNRSEPSSLIANRRVLVTGAGGSIGSELCMQIASFGPAEMVLLENCEFNLYMIDLKLSERFPNVPRHAMLCDVRQRGSIMRLFRKFEPELVFHAAALKHVPLVEANPIEAFETNTLGTRNVADAAIEVRSGAVVQISTDKAVNPTSIMGASKRLAEYYTQALDLTGGSAGVEVPNISTRFITVRFGNVLGSSGSVVQLFQRQLAHGGPLTVTHPDIERYFMTVTEAVSLILQAAAYGAISARERGRILVLDMGLPVRVVDLAHQMIRLAGYRPDKDICIEFTGLRPGEKLKEELFDPAEELIETGVSGVFSARAATLPLTKIRPILDDLSEVARSDDVNELRRRIADLIPGCCLDATVHLAAFRNGELGVAAGLSKLS